MNLSDYFEEQGHGSLSRMASAINAFVPDISRWASGKRRCPPSRCVAIERFTNGAVTRKDLRPHDYKEIWPELD